MITTNQSESLCPTRPAMERSRQTTLEPQKENNGIYVFIGHYRTIYDSICCLNQFTVTQKGAGWCRLPIL